ncbi:MAG: hypothetical protein R6U57_01130 [Anaerolineales bacterium]
MEPGTILLWIVGVVLVVLLIALLGGGMAAGGMAMMAGMMMGTPAGWIALVVVALIALAGYLLYVPGG